MSKSFKKNIKNIIKKFQISSQKMWFPFCHKILTRHPLYLEYTTLDCAILDCSPQVWSCYSLYIGSPSSRAWASLLDVSIALALAPFLGVCADAASVAPLLPQNMYFYMEYTSFDCARLSHRWCHATHHITSDARYFIVAIVMNHNYSYYEIVCIRRYWLS